jgi:hypothetical protein
MAVFRSHLPVYWGHSHIGYHFRNSNWMPKTNDCPTQKMVSLGYIGYAPCWLVPNVCKRYISLTR